MGWLSRVLGLGWLGSVDLVFLTRLRPIFRQVFSLLPAVFLLPISVLFLSFPLYLSFFFLFWEFCGLKVPKTTDLRRLEKPNFLTSVTDDGAYTKAQNAPWVIVLSLGILLVVVTDRFVSVFGWFGGSSEKLETRRRLSEISLSRIFFLFSLCRYSNRCWESWAEGCAWCGRRSAWGPRNSAVAGKLASFSATKFFFFFFIVFFFFFFSFPGHYSMNYCMLTLVHNCLCYLSCWIGKNYELRLGRLRRCRLDITLDWDSSRVPCI